MDVGPGSEFDTSRSYRVRKECVAVVPGVHPRRNVQSRVIEVTNIPNLVRVVQHLFGVHAHIFVAAVEDSPRCLEIDS
jgi:hypothetical protein